MDAVAGRVEVMEQLAFAFECRFGVGQIAELEQRG
jgi:hypothetical protein